MLQGLGAAVAVALVLIGGPLPAQAEPTASDLDGCRAIPADAAPALHAEPSALGGIDGTGVTVGIISDSFDSSSTTHSRAADDIAAGLLPGPGNPCGHEQPVELVGPQPSTGSDEGRAMAQVVHSVAPGARLMFIASPEDQDAAAFAQTIQQLADAGADVIVDDEVLFDEPAYEQSVVGRTIETLAAQGIVYLTSAGNYSVGGAPGTASEGYDIAGWSTGAYRPTSCPDAVVDALRAKGRTGSLDCMDFAQDAAPDATDTLRISTSDPQNGVLYWAEPVGAVRGSFVPVLTSPDGTVIVGATEQGTPAAALILPALPLGDYDLSIVRDAQVPITPAITLRWSLKEGLLDAEYHASVGDDVVGATITGHQADESVISVAAASVASPTVAEPYSSAGPAVHLFESTPSGVSVPLAEPMVFPGPDITGVARMRTNFFSTRHPVAGQPGVWEFWGTSAAAPSMAGVVALGKQVAPGVTTAEVKAALAATARPSTAPYAHIDPVRMTGPGVADASAFVALLRGADPTPPAPPVPPTPDVSEPAASAPQLAATGAAPAPLGALAALLAGLGGMLLARARARSGRFRCLCGESRGQWARETPTTQRNRP
ncbi:hypothetical protein GCM10010988_17600 [Cnuibacter physcomitrellae]|nr:hypothetical protein GCM10010988_17600 [Cnuibacter physcomitrellae]